jgi:probable rRNA maturation factor
VRGRPHRASSAPIRELTFINLQRTKPINSRKLREITEAALAELPNVTGWNLTFYLVGAKKMAEINESHMHHEGPTDVITFDYSDLVTGNSKLETRNPKLELLGEIFICPDVAVTQAREFRTTWQSELVRYVVHALLHLYGHDDLKPAARREMKRHENRLVRLLARRFRFAGISK